MTKAPSRKATAVLGWFPTTPATEREIIDMANSRQIALRTRLRHSYWLTDCQPLTAVTVDLQRKKMAMIDPQDCMTDEQVAELLSPHFGFAVVASGVGEKPVAWTIPDLDEARAEAVGSIEAMRGRAAAAGRASAAIRAARAAGAGPQAEAVAPELVPDGEDF